MTMQNFAIASTLSGNLIRSSQQFYDDMSKFQERKENKIAYMREK